MSVVETPILERVLRHDRAIVTGGLTAVAVLSWLYILTGAGMTMESAWTPSYFATMLVMWWVMMIAMMLPSAVPMVLLFAAISRKKREAARPYAPVAALSGGYVAAWAGFSLAATLMQWWLDRLVMLSPHMAGTSAYLGAGLLIAAGVYQLTPLKHACLRHCRAPFAFLNRRRRDGAWGAFVMGLEHGLFCLGCCWMLMGLLFYGGVMNLWWIAGLAAYVLFEKLLPLGHWVGRFGGVVLLVWGAAVLLA